MFVMRGVGYRLSGGILLGLFFGGLFAAFVEATTHIPAGQSAADTQLGLAGCPIAMLVGLVLGFWVTGLLVDDYHKGD
jgi:hypothetical protein